MKIIVNFIILSLLAIFLTTCKKSNGEKVSYFKSGEISSILEYKSGILNGIQKYFYGNGVLKETIKYKDGIRTGNSYKFYENGALMEISRWKDDGTIERVNTFYNTWNWVLKSFKVFDKQGLLIIDRKYDTTGMLLP
jgi:antitoxin component YwqK of YwqJK toxin-antitoxin module